MVVTKWKSILPLLLLGFLILLPGIFLGAQDILTAANYFNEISQRYGKIQDYEADITITRGEVIMAGKLFYRTPNLLRIDFTEPQDQVLVTDGKLLTIYIPKYEVIMEQKLKRRSQAALATMAGSQGLILLQRNYSVAYFEGPDPTPLEEGSTEKAVQLKLTSRSTSEGFRQINIFVGGNGLIRRISAITLRYEELVYDFEDIKVNQNIPENRFLYDSPSYANVYSDFLFNAEE